MSRCGGCMTRRHSNTTIDQFKSAWRKSPSLPPWVRAGWCGGRIQMFPSVAPHTAITLDYNSAHLLIRGVPSPLAVYWLPTSIVPNCFEQHYLFVFCATVYWSSVLGIRIQQGILAALVEFSAAILQVGFVAVVVQLHTKWSPSSSLTHRHV